MTGLVTALKMTKPTEHAFAGNAMADSREGDFGCTVMDLRKLMELRSADAMNHINVHYGGVMSLCSRLKTNPVEGKGRGPGTWRGVVGGPLPGVCVCGGKWGLAGASER